jgi:multiple sugar transport system substrate-binding protein
VQPRITAAIQSGSGADLFMLFYNWPQLYQNSLVDVSDVATAIAKDQGGFVDMYAKAVQGMKAEDAVKWAEGELKKVYES